MVQLKENRFHWLKCNTEKHKNSMLKFDLSQSKFGIKNIKFNIKVIKNGNCN